MKYYILKTHGNSIWHKAETGCGVGRSSTEERQIEGQWVIGLITRDSQLVQQRPSCVLSCLWDGAHNISLTFNQKVVVAGFLFLDLIDP